MNTIEVDIEKYLNGEMTEEEIAIFIKRIDEDPNAKKMLELYQEMDIVYNDKNWELTNRKLDYKKVNQYERFFKSDKGKSIADTILKAEQSYFNEKPLSRRKQVFKYVAAIAAVFIIGLFLVNQFNKKANNNQLYAQYKNWDVLPSLALRGGAADLASIEKLFREEKYEESLDLLHKYVLDTQQEVNPQIVLYTGVIQLELNQKEAAISTFMELLNSNTLDAPKAHWYLALCYLKLNNLEKTKKELNLLIDSTINFQKTEAKEILQRLE